MVDVEVVAVDDLKPELPEAVGDGSCVEDRVVETNGVLDRPRSRSPARRAFRLGETAANETETAKPKAIAAKAATRAGTENRGRMQKNLAILPPLAFTFREYRNLPMNAQFTVAL